MSTRASALSSFKGSSPALDRRGWNLALAFQEVFTAIVRLRYNRQAVSNAESFRAQIKQALRVAEQEARSGGYSAEDVKQAVFALVAFLDESALSCRNPAFADWARLPLQAEMFGHQLAGEVFFQELQKTLTRSDSGKLQTCWRSTTCACCSDSRAVMPREGTFAPSWLGFRKRFGGFEALLARCRRVAVSLPTPFAWYSRTAGFAGWGSLVLWSAS